MPTHTEENHMLTADMAHKIAAHIAAGNADGQALDIIEAALKARRTELTTDGLPEVTLREGIRPLYLAGCKGRLGRSRGTKLEFYPNPGTRAFQRSQGRPWKINLTALSAADQETHRGW